ncbi:xanthine dehydrogenase family protein subunit M [Nonomuraea sp. NN258]|uniref:FAD binding domain-containing protein n=1 Tax=Nonomuraea antri TaxID=2730852 RepID=UPI0015682941|nr:xanthine dehydrogenase family protein subunit M [Nonomuraea antri]NRQ37893.1 xanthine dehydrogenase family protein subunit M [Nonomuraea antri]
MRNFAYHRPADVPAALLLKTRHEHAKFLGGGTNLVDLMRENVERPDTLIDVTGLPLNRIEELPDGGVSIGATAVNTAVAGHPLIRARYPVLAQAILSGASGQIRNMATVGGNLLQRTRCTYFYDDTARCNKREPGAGCDAVDGVNRGHAILGASPSCIATHPSDMCVALAALDATVHVEGPDGARAIPFRDFHRLPGDTPQVETELREDELITSVALPAAAAGDSLYRKVRDRASYAFALVSVAAVVEHGAGVIADARLALGGVAHKPWRATAAERVLRGAAADEETFVRAADAELAGARGQAGNGFKIEMARRAIVAVLRRLTAPDDDANRARARALE